jgi:hypothetical protein
VGGTLRDVAPSNSLFNEKIAGTVHAALGRSYPENVGALHWDLIGDRRPGGRLSADGEMIVENGIFAWPFEPSRRWQRHRAPPLRTDHGGQVSAMV